MTDPIRDRGELPASAPPCLLFAKTVSGALRPIAAAAPAAVAKAARGAPGDQVTVTARAGNVTVTGSRQALARLAALLADPGAPG
jgi:hypothetical protein